LRPRLLLLGALFAASGAAALMAETTWLRWFRLLFGATAPAVSATLVAFLLGQAVGAAGAARAAPRIRHPLRAYAVLQCGAAAAVAAVPPLLRAGEAVLGALYPLVEGSAAGLAALRLAVAVLATLPAAAGFGAALPLLAMAVVAQPERLGRDGALWYGLETAGAAAGAAAAAFWLPGALGVSGGYGVAVALGLAAGLGALGLARSREPLRPRAPEASRGSTSREPATGVGGSSRVPPAAAKRSAAREPAAGVGGSSRVPAAIAALSGFASFASQVLLVQGLAQVLNGSVYAFGSVVVVTLLALATGAAVVSWVERTRALEPPTLLAFALAAAALALAGFPALLAAVTDGFSYVGADSPGLGYLRAALGTTAAAAAPCLAALALLFPASLALAAAEARPKAAQRATGGRKAEARAGGSEASRAADGAAAVGRRLGLLLAANTAGAIAGALAGAWALLPTLGLWPSFAALGALLALAGLAIRPPRPAAAFARDAALALGWVAVLWLANPLGLPPLHLAPGESLLWHHTGASGVVAVVERDGERLIRTDNYSVLGGTAETLHQRRQGHLPLLLHPTAERVAYVGSATGISAGAVLDHPVTELRLVELVPAVAEGARRFFGEANHGVYEDPRVAVAVDDARNHFRASDERYDVVVADLFVPWRSGTGSLYTREHFAAVRERLAPDGLFLQWLPLYQLSGPELRSILATFLDVFPRAALYRGDFYGAYPILAVAGWKGEVAPAEAVADATRRLAARGEPDRWLTTAPGPWTLYLGPLAPLAEPLAGVPRNRDDRPVVEYAAAGSHAGGGRGSVAPVTGDRLAGLLQALAGASDGGADPIHPDLGAEAARLRAGGDALQAAGILFAEGRREDAARAFARARTLLPPGLVEDAPPDPSASEVWVD